MYIVAYIICNIIENKEQTMKKHFRIIALSLAFVILATSCFLLNSCVNPGNNGNEGDSTSAPPDVTTVITDDQSKLTELEVQNIGGEILMLWPELHGDGHFVHNELGGTGSAAGDRIDSEVFKRNSIVEEAYAVELSITTERCGQIPKTVRADFANGESTYDAVATNIALMSPIALEGLLFDFNELNYYEENQEWWNHKLMQDFSIANKRFFASGDIIYSDDFYPWCVYINNALATQYTPDADYYELVLSKQWTIKKMHEYAVMAVTPDGQGEYSVDSLHGALVGKNFAKALYYSAGKGMISNDADGFPIWEMTPDHTQDILETIINAWHTDNAFFETKNNMVQGLTAAQLDINLFNESKALFFAGELIVTERISKSDSAIEDYLIVPTPLYKEGSEYRCMLNDSVIISIPKRGKRIQETGLVLSAMSRESVETLTPAFFELVLKAKYLSNPESVDMLGMVLDSAVPQDVATISDWGGLMTSFKDLVSKGSFGFQSEYEKKATTALKTLDEYITSLEGVAAEPTAE